ncbi:fimbrial biogenesis chaperone [Amantichitinum ursilacus]|nr:fimbria/pilus periplasmic chaperone [Amantichitinum ursilacus]
MFSISAYAGISVGSTRVIFDASQSALAVPIQNGDNRPYLVQSWVDDQSGQKAPFLVTPPLVRVDAKKSMTLKIISTGAMALPQDRESVFYLNVKEIPPKAETENVLQLAIRTRIKFFYRPAQLQGTAADAPAQLQWRIAPDEQGRLALEVSNPSAYAVTVVDASANGAPLRNDMVLPQSKLRYPLPAAAGDAVAVSFSAMNDFGGVTAPITLQARRAATTP